MRLVTGTLFAIAKDWKQLKYLSIQAELVENCDTYTQWSTRQL